MFILKQWYLMIFRGWIKTDTKWKGFIKFSFFLKNQEVESVYLGKDMWLISPPKSSRGA